MDRKAAALSIIQLTNGIPEIVKTRFVYKNAFSLQA